MRPWKPRSRRPGLLVLLAASLLLPACSAPGTGNGRTAGPERAGIEPGPESRRVIGAERVLMGTTFRIRIVTGDDDAGIAAVEAAFDEVSRVEALLSEWKETSEITAVNRSAGIRPVAVGAELFEVVERSVWAADVTGGAFDVTFAGCGRLWSFARPVRPTADEMSRCLAEVGFHRLELDAGRSTIFLPSRGMRIGIAGIGKGFGVDRAAEVLEQRGITDYIVDGGGDVRLRGGNVDRPWRTGIAHPRDRGRLFATVQVDGGAIVTSGDYQQYFELDGVRYHHILDPSTGEPARRSVAVTVIASNAMDADALATGLFVIGPDRGLELVERLDGVEALFFDPRLEVRGSTGFPELDRAGGG